MGDAWSLGHSLTSLSAGFAAVVTRDILGFFRKMCGIAQDFTTY